MSIIKSSGAGDPVSTGFYSHTIDQSLRCNGSNEYLTRTPSSSGNRRTWTFSAWVKLGVDGVRFPLIEAYSNGTNFTMFNVHTDGRILFYTITSAIDYGGLTTQKLRDPSAWYHIVFRFDTTQSTAADRMRLYVNGEQQETNPWTSYGQIPQNYDNFINHTVPNHIIKNTNSSQYGQGYIAEVHHIDGTSYAPETFAERIDGVWVPKDVSGSGLSYGTNGFHLDFADSSDIGNNANTTDGTNDFTVNNFTASDVVLDSPTNNFTTFSPIDAYNAGSQLSNANLTYTGAGANDGHGATQTFDIANDKFYWEVYIAATNSWIGIISEDFSLAQKSFNVYSGSGMYAINPANGYKTQDPYASSSSFITAASAGDVIGFACGDGKITIYYNGVSKGDMFTSLTGRYKPFIMSATSAASTFNFGQDHTFNGNKTSGSDSASDANGIGVFYDTPPTGFLALCTSNMSDPTIGPGQTSQADDHFDTVLFSGTGANQTVTGFNFQPDFVWNKTRNQSRHHTLNDSVRGGGPLKSSNADGEGASTISAYNSDGYDWTYNSSNVWYDSSATVVSWAWKAGGSASSNFNGSITSSVSANQDAGFSIVSWTGTGSAGTIGHGLSSAPEHIIVKNRDSTAGRIWLNYVKAAASDAETDYLTLSGTGAAVDNADVWNDTAPTSTVFSVGSNASANESADEMIAYCFHSVEGYSKFGSYTGNGNADGTFVYTGFRPAWIMQKKSSSSGNDWTIYDTARDTFNPAEDLLRPNLANAESDTTSFDILSNGFKIRSSAGTFNASGATFIYLAFAEAPFKFANAR